MQASPPHPAPHRPRFTRVGFFLPSFDLPASDGRDAAVASVGVAPDSSAVAWVCDDDAGRWASPAARAKGQSVPPAAVLARPWPASATDAPARTGSAALV